MEVPIISRISDFEAGISRLQNPSLFSKILSRSGADDAASNLHTFWTWGALILAVVAAVSSLIRRAKLLLLRVPKADSLISQAFLQPSYSSDDDDDDASSSSSSSCSSSDAAESDDDDGRFFTPMAAARGGRRRESFAADSEMDFRVAGSGNLRSVYGQVSRLRRWHRCLADAAASGESQFSRSVVKLWDGLGLGVEGSTGSISVWDFNIKDKVRSFSAGRTNAPAICAPSPSIVMSAGTVDGCRTTMRVWDARLGSQTPAVVAEWAPPGTEVVGIGAGGVEKVYVRDGFGRVTVRDLRKVRKPLPEEAEETDWYDADGVMFDGDSLSDGSDVTARAAGDGGDQRGGLLQRRRRQG